MSTSSHRETAQIIPFVPRARLTGAAARTVPASGHHAVPRPAPAVDWESGWYHEAAIQEDVRGRHS